MGMRRLQYSFSDKSEGEVINKGAHNMTIENLKYRFDGGKPTQGVTAIVGVLGSGNLEVLVEPVALGGACEIEVSTAARGFGTIWQAVMKDFFARHRAGDIRISVNDAGATPAIVSLRLDQAIETFTAKGKK
jgi:malonate decarboxylase delta subunit